MKNRILWMLAVPFLAVALPVAAQCAQRGLTISADADRWGRYHALIVGINSDASVRRLKGPSRPIQPECDRAQIVASQASVDAVVVFDEDTPLELIQSLKPHVLTKGADYGNKEAVVGWEQVESWGGQVVLIQLVDGRSTTKLVQHAA